MIGEACRELADEIGKRFHAVDGPEYAFFELGNLRVVYTTWALHVLEADSAVAAEKMLCGVILEALSKLAGGEDTTPRVLFWRKRPYVDVDPYLGMLRVSVRMRLATRQAERGDHPPAPPSIDARAQQVVEEVVPRRDRVEHVGDAPPGAIGSNRARGRRAGFRVHASAFVFTFTFVRPGRLDGTRLHTNVGP
jgi:hypothetical protein